MRKAAKITISLPAKLLEQIDRHQQERGETRSEFIRHAIEKVLREHEEREKIEQYIRGYREHPETEEEIQLSNYLSAEAAAREPWE